MELILQTGLEHQQKPVDAISGVFKGVCSNSPAQFFENPTFELGDIKIINNIKEQQVDKHVHKSIQAVSPPQDCLNLDIKMETGTGKTYVYTHTIYELHKQYGINKFIIAVPSLPIKAGTQQFISDPYVQRHFQNTRGYNATIDLCILKSMAKKKGRSFFPSVVRAFVDGSCQDRNRIYVLLVNTHLLTNGNLLSRDDYDYGVQGFYRPFNALRATKPFIIIDEPHRFQREQTAYKKIIEELQPQCIIRFGATFPNISVGRGKGKITKVDYLNLLYDLNACDAFNQNLIKGVAKEHFEPATSRNEKIKITSIESKTTVSFKHETTNGSRFYTLQKDDSLGIICEELSGLTINGIGNGKIELSNGLEKQTGEEFTVDIYSESYQEQMVRLAIQRHFETERANYNRNIKIKTLALFFIDNIESYRGDSNESGWLKEIFERLLKERLELELAKNNSEEYHNYLLSSLNNISACHAGYFSQDNSDSDEAIAAEVDEILHNKKKLLSFVNEDGSLNTRRFLFSKWTLKEGWDNPNVFTIAKLRSSGSENSKIQEVGRGLRLPVDEYGNRISNEEFLLNYIVDFTEADFANKLVAQINNELPTTDTMQITAEDLTRVGNTRGIGESAFMIELLQKGYIDINRNIISEKIDDFFSEYPEFNQKGVSSSKIVNRNKKATNTIRVRQAQFNELKELWNILNRKYIIFFNNEVDILIEKELPLILKAGVFADTELISRREMLGVEGEQLRVVNDTGVAYIIQGKRLPYNNFLTRLNRATCIPITTIHNAMCTFVKDNDKFKESFINESSLTRIIKAFDDWKCENLQGRFNYKQTNYTPASTALTNSDGSLKTEVVQGNIGIHLEKGNISEKYLYDSIAYDSDLERENIMTEIDEVIVYGKIPRKSISIPTIADSSYSPDFMYVTKMTNGQKELNIIVETKDVEGKSSLRGNEQAKIQSAKQFFGQLKLDGYNVSFRTQLNNKGMRTIITELINENN